MSDYIPSGNPLSQTRAIAAQVRNEFALIATAIATKLSGDAVNAYSATQTYNGVANFNGGGTFVGAYNFTGATVSFNLAQVIAFGTITVTTQALSDSSTKAASTAYVQSTVQSLPPGTLPTLLNNSGKFLTNDGTTVSWGPAVGNDIFLFQNFGGL